MAANQPSKSELREQAKNKAAALRAEQLKKEARVRRITLLSIILGLILVAALIAVVVVNGNKKNTVSADAAGPTVATGVNGGIPFGKDGIAGTTNEGAINVEVYADFLCPWCGKFEETNNPTLNEYREAGKITVVIHPLSMLSRGSKTAYSSRSAGAFAYVAQNEPDKALAFNQTLYDNQPDESGSGLTDDEIVDLAKQAGVSDTVAAASVGGEFIDWTINNYTRATQNTVAAGEDGSFSTPTIIINNTKYAGSPTDADAFKAALDAAVGS
ncbi:DsbA family protein [Rarobacter incanus]|uniref:Protein-disulfide isomerase n=1 Tax=Rarobacter incanus TaxID=153494 RepID=A0A542SP18_9MICO|nr:thioredoxin domain-containing protein [Rarobacter incanus]TQK76332.1 protein-disulfide isomerase [Rarobacter incanus]